MPLDFDRWVSKKDKSPLAVIRVKQVVSRERLVLAAADLADDFEGNNEYQPEPDTITRARIEERLRDIFASRGSDGFEFLGEGWNRPVDCMETGEAAVTLAFPELTTVKPVDGPVVS
jgi:hypothetical protein